MKNNDMNLRLLVFGVVTVVFFLAYDYFLMPAQNAKTAIESQEKNTAPVVDDIKDISAPSANKAPEVIPSTKTLAVVKTAKYTIEIDEFARVLHVVLNGENHIDENGRPIDLISAKTTLLPLELRISDKNLNKEAFEIAYISDKSMVDATTAKATLVMTQNLTNATIIKTMTFYPDGHYDMKIQSSVPSPFFVTTGSTPFGDDDSNHFTAIAFKGAVVKSHDNIIFTMEDGDFETKEAFDGAKLSGVANRYYASFFYNLDAGLNTVVDTQQENPLVYIKGENELYLNGYFGPKEFDTLSAISPEITPIIEYGWFTFIAEPIFYVLELFENYFGNWGWAIVVFTLMVKIILYPLTYKGMVSMNKLKDLAPKMKEIQEKYKGDAQRSSAAMMELYKKHGANPLGGCLPMLLQIPIFFAIYRVILNSVELKGAEWTLWIGDLSVQDPYYILPVLMGLFMYLQQVLTPQAATVNEDIQKAMKFMPIIFSAMLLFAPAGLVLYWTVNTALSAAQQYIINKQFEKQKHLAQEAGHGKN